MFALDTITLLQFVFFRNREMVARDPLDRRSSVQFHPIPGNSALVLGDLLADPGRSSVDPGTLAHRCVLRALKLLDKVLIAPISNPDLFVTVGPYVP